MWEVLEVQPAILTRAREYLDASAALGSPAEFHTHVALHVRRGDYKYFNHEKIMADPSVPNHKKEEIDRIWNDADEEVLVR